MIVYVISCALQTDLALFPSMITRVESSTTSLPLSVSLGVTGVTSWLGGAPSRG